jgi:Family of unknown function (DUF6511)
MLCAICRRDARGFQFVPGVIGVKAPLARLCSRHCQQLIARRKGMLNPNIHECNALKDAGQAGGVFVETLAKTDLATWSPEEWSQLVDVIVTAFQDSLRTAYADDPPL